MSQHHDRSVSFVTAGAGGAGRGIVLRLVEAGYQVLTCDIDRAAVAGIDGHADAVSARYCDLSRPDQVTDVFRAMTEKLGRLDLLVNNVGIAGPTAAAEDVTIEDWEHTLRCNLTSYFVCAKLAIPLMKARQGGCIVNISSASVKVGLPLRLPYIVSKAAIISLTTNLARELGPFGIRVNAILPGPIEGERVSRIVAAKSRALGVSEDAYRADLLRYVSLRTMVSPDDIASAILYLASSAGQRVTGQCIAVDGNLEYEA